MRARARVQLLTHVQRNSWRSHSATDSKELSNEEYDRFMQGLEATKTNKDVRVEIYGETPGSAGNTHAQCG